MIGSLMSAVGLMLSSQVRETWQLFLSHSLFTGIGVALAYTNIVAYIGITICDKHISIVNGVTLAGTAVGWITIPLLINVLRGLYGWRSSLLLLGAVGLHATVLSLILFRSTRKESQSKISKINCEFSEANLDKDSMELHSEDVEDNENADAQPKKTKVQLLKEYLQLPVTYPLFGYLIIVTNLISIAFVGTLYHLVASANTRGVPETKATLLMTFYGIGSIIGRIFNGVPNKLKLIKTKNTFLITLIVAGLSTFLLPFCRTYQSMVSVTFFIGLSTGACIPLLYILTREIVGIQNFPNALGMLLFTTAFINVVAGFITGWIYDLSGSYNTAFFIMGSFYILGCFVIIVPTVGLKYKKARTCSKHVTVKSSEVIGLSSPESVGTEL
ncbi:monocarboxylate transporter 12-B-like isoform X2 [Anneissia japonica]|nr:monocarboxylate transporter 12-B-like isoform X2 [Anneissia japonica]XP_033102610.1 monocarboxylate transporter 12-B-like isoform X2 [Anneissia japonica]XP_033102620.1 monocarboxylate transporter 12-B-like isoform X2 [Anneissia japonica]